MKSHIKIYLLSIFFALLVVELFFVLQIIFVIKQFQPQYAIVPTLLGTTIGLLIGKVLVLRKKLTAKEKIFHTIADDAKEFSYFKTIEGKYDYVSPACETLTGYTQEEFYNSESLFDEIICRSNKHTWNDHLKKVRTEDYQHDDIEIKIVDKNGQDIWINHNCSTVYENGEKIGVRSVNSDITKRKKDEEEIIALSLYDTLTGLPNRKYIFKKLHELEEKNKQFSIVFLDLNRFKKVNDSLGHTTGDQVLKQVANNFKKCDKNTSFIGRLGGDEFIIIFEGMETKEEIQLYTKELYSIVAKEYTIEDYTFYIGASMGVAFFPADSNNIYDILVCADKAMYNAKNITSSDIVYYSDVIKHNQSDSFFTEKNLREALKYNKLDVYLQAKFSTQLDCISGCEALIRWKDNNTFIPPSVFIPIAEETGLIKEITRYVIKETFSFVKSRHSQENFCKISINLSMIDLMSNTFVDYVKEQLNEYKLEASLFEFELTESIFLEDSKKVTDNIHKLINLGFKIALDDFGTGYSSLSYLTKLPINTLKIDKSFIDNLDQPSNKNLPLLKSIVTIAKDLELGIVIEGVETVEQLNLINELGSFVIQGYYFYKPMTFEEISSLKAS